VVRKALVLLLSGGFLAGCASPVLSPAVDEGTGAAALRARSAPAQTQYKSIYSFEKHGDGAGPFGGLTSFDGVLYGTTYLGGLHGAFGTVYQITGAGVESVIYSFKGGHDGARPFAGLINVGGLFYGTTQEGGGKSNDGTVFQVTPAGKESVVHGFKGGSDGEYPRASLTQLNGTLYGTTYFGGPAEQGTVFQIASGKESVLYSFQGGTDGARPYAGLLAVGDMLYGTTSAGGYDNDGTVFSVNGYGQEQIVHSFSGGADGAAPFAGLIAVNGTLYGTTRSGGTDNDGTVFQITGSGEESVLYSFQGGTDGSTPDAPLVDVYGTLYGTTRYGGANNLGTIYTITTGGSESVLYSFQGGSTDGYGPFAGLTNMNGILYGTTPWGGAKGRGTVFSVAL